MEFFEAFDVYHDSMPRTAALNMAVDEALLGQAGVSSLRFYGWESPALSFGYFGKYENAAEEGAGRDLVRRWTGGGIVLHGDDLTYSLIVPASDRCFTLPSTAIYSAIHRAICEALKEEGKNALLATSAAPKISDACFANAVVADVLLGANKVAGAAQRRTRAGLLQQGSIQVPQLSPVFPKRLAAALCSSHRVRDLSPELIGRAEKIAEAKYATEQWLRRR